MTRFGMVCQQRKRLRHTVFSEVSRVAGVAWLVVDLARLIAVTIDLFNRQPEAYADMATNVPLRLTVKCNIVQRTGCKVAESAQAVR